MEKNLNKSIGSGVGFVSALRPGHGCCVGLVNLLGLGHWWWNRIVG